MSINRLESERLILRHFTLEDAEEMFSSYASDQEVTRYLSWHHHESVEQTKMILYAFDNGFTLEQIKSCAVPDFDSAVMGPIFLAYKSGLTVEQMRLALNPKLSYVQIKWVIDAISNGWEEKKIKLLANPEFLFDQVGLQR